MLVINIVTRCVKNYIVMKPKPIVYVFGVCHALLSLRNSLRWFLQVQQQSSTSARLLQWYGWQYGRLSPYLQPGLKRKKTAFVSDVSSSFQVLIMQWRIQDFPEGGAMTDGGATYYLAKTAWKWKKLDWRGSQAPSSDPPLLW